MQSDAFVERLNQVVKDDKIPCEDFSIPELQKVADYLANSHSDLTYSEMSVVVNAFTNLIQSATRNINTINALNGDPPKDISK